MPDGIDSQHLLRPVAAFWQDAVHRAAAHTITARPGRRVAGCPCPGHLAHRSTVAPALPYPPAWQREPSRSGTTPACRTQITSATHILTRRRQVRRAWLTTTASR